MRYRNEVHVYPAIDTVLQRLVVAIVGYDTEHCFDDWFDESDLQLIDDVDDAGNTIIVDPYGGILDATKDEDMADLILFILETLQSSGHIEPQLHVVVDDQAIWLSHDYDATEVSIEDYLGNYDEDDEDIEDVEDDVEITEVSDFEWLTWVCTAVHTYFVVNSEDSDDSITTHGIILCLGHDDDITAITDPVQATVARAIADQTGVVYAS